MKPPPFEYRRPESVDEALDLLAEAGHEAKVLAGGQSLVPLLNFRMARPAMLVDIGRLSELDHLSLENGSLTVGALTTHRQVERLDGLESRCPLMAEAISQIGHVAIRNRGTVGGSMAHADPAAEWPVIALLLDAEFEVRSARGSRTVSAEEMFVGYMQSALRPDELLTGIRLTLPPAEAGSAFVEVSRRHGDFAMGGAGAVLRLEADEVAEARVAVLGAGLTAIRSREAEEALVGRPPGDEALREAARAVAAMVDPLEDVHAPADYKRHLAEVTSFRALTRARGRVEEGTT